MADGRHSGRQADAQLISQLIGDPGRTTGPRIARRHSLCPRSTDVVDALRNSQAQMLGMEHGFVQEGRDVTVEEGVADGAAGSGGGHHAHHAQQAELVRDGGLLHADRGGHLRHRGGALAKMGQDEQPTWRGQGLQSLRYASGGLCVK